MTRAPDNRSVRYRHPSVESWLRAQRPIQEIWWDLQAAGTLDFPALSTGLYSAAIVHAVDDDPTGYRSAWVRDNVHIAHALSAVGRDEEAVRCCRALAKFFETQLPKFDRAIAEGRAPTDSNDRPHIRFDGERLVEYAEPWAHAQNDALGYFLWLYGGLVARSVLNPVDAERAVVARMIAYLAAIEYWSDADSGHWEEERKVCASSIGAVVAGLKAVKAALVTPAADGEPAAGFGPVDDLIAEGESALARILPDESRDSAHSRQADAALLFLIEPLRLLDVDSSIAQAILRRTEADLLGPHGVRRYLDDSYWAPDFRRWQADWGPSTDAAYREARQRLAVAGQEAQWGLFDPILCAIYARSAAPDAAAHRDWHFHRSLAQLTGPDDPPAPLRCVEAYFVEDGAWVSNDHVPLLWTQANLLLALKAMGDATALDPYAAHP